MCIHTHKNPGKLQVGKEDLPNKIIFVNLTSHQYHIEVELPVIFKARR